MRSTNIVYQIPNVRSFLNASTLYQIDDDQPVELDEQQDVDMVMSGSGSKTILQEMFQSGAGCHDHGEKTKTKKRKLPRDILLSSLPKKQKGAFIFSAIAAAIAAISAATSAASVATGITAASLAGAVATGAATAVGGIVAKKIAGGSIKKKIEKTFLTTKVGVHDLSQKGKHVAKQAEKYIRENPENIRKVVKILTPYVRTALEKKVKDKLGMSGQGLMLAGRGGNLDSKIEHMAMKTIKKEM